MKPDPSTRPFRSPRSTVAPLALTGAILLASPPAHAAMTDGMEKGNPDLQSAGSLAFGPEGILFVADAKGAAVVAIATGDSAAAKAAAIDIKNVDAKIAGVLGTGADDIQINDLAVNPVSGNTYLSVSRGRGADAAAAIVTIGPDGEPQLFELDDVLHSKLELGDAPADEVTGEGRRARNRRLESITDLAYLDGRLAIAGLSNEEFASTLRVARFPFDGELDAAGIEIYHGAHGKLETHSPIRTFTPMDIDGEATIVASYTCTPLVTIPLSELRPDAKVTGITVAELGNRNRPLDMVTYDQGGKKFILMANSSRGVMKVSTEGISDIEPISERVEGETEGLPYETVEGWDGVTQLDRAGDAAVIVLREDEGGAEHLDLRPVP